MVSKILNSKGFVFDLDGTLIDTTPLVIKCWTEIANEHNVDPNQILATSHGRRTIETLAEWIPEIATNEYVNALEARVCLIKEGVTVLPGVIDLLASIPNQDWTVNTAGTHIMAITRLAQFGIHVPEKLSTGDKLKFGKPHPEGYLMAAEMINKDPKDCIAFEDAPAGVKAAIAAGMECIACVTTHTIEQLREAGATVIVKHLDSVRVEKQENGSYNTIIENVIE